MTLKSKYLLLIIGSIFLSFANVFGQYLSFETGYIATHYLNMLPYTHQKGGFQLGIGYAKPIKDSSLFVKTGINYLQLNGKGTIDYFNQVNQVVLSYQKTQELYYLQVPLLLHYQIQSKQMFKLGVQAGLNLNGRLRAWHNPQPREISHNVTSSFQPFVLGYQLGANATYKLSSSVGLQFLYHFGSNISSVQKQNSQSGFFIHTFTLALVGDIKQILKQQASNIDSK